LKEAGAKFSPPISKPLLTERHRYGRLQWAQATHDMDWDRVIFSDEATVRLNQLKPYVWNLPGKKKVVRTVALVASIASEKILTSTCSVRFISAASCRLPKINSNENQLIENCKKTMIQSIRPNLQINGNRSIEFSDFTGHQYRRI
jgi:hypothetical protein